MVIIRSSCEIDTACRKVLTRTFGPATNGQHCVFANILEIQRGKPAFCISHNKMCALKKKTESDRTSASFEEKLSETSCSRSMNEFITDWLLILFGTNLRIDGQCFRSYP